MIRHLFRDRDIGHIRGWAGALGTGLPTALGVKLARPEDIVVCVIGDGAFNYNPVPACLGLAQQYGVPILVVICNNQGYVSQEWNLYKYFPSGYALRDNNPYGRVIEPTPDYAAIAPAFGAHGECVTDPGQLELAIRRALMLWSRGDSHCWTSGSNREANMADVVLRPGQNTLADWRAIYRGAGVTLDPAAHAADRRRRARRRGHPRQRRTDLWHQHRLRQAWRASASSRPTSRQLQRNIVLSHAAGVGEPMPAPLVRLMLALKLASLGAWRFGRAAGNRAVPGCDACRTTCCRSCRRQGSVGASGDLAPLAHMAAAMIGVGEIDRRGERKPAADGAGAGRPAADRARRQGRACAAERHAILDRLCARRAVRGGNAVAGRPDHRRAVDRRGARLRCAVRSAHPRAARPSRADRRRPAPCAR